MRRTASVERTQKRHGRSARETVGEAVERRDRIRRGRRQTSPSSWRRMKREGRKKGVREGGTERSEEARVRARENTRGCVAYVYMRTHVHMCVQICVSCVRVRVPHCGLEEVERIRENRVSFRSTSARGLGPFVLSS